ncbi:Hpt domain-containing protein [Solirubrobacter sp. CPCC 204708]|uniref:Hpt domain-containing protein n=1 Tax=Solirubrobacter deserti TaxID=2282478 RepID=A0ABT4REL8_9ACTN|nr:Hpt domain-containing protein [Solirubrobacter deserti]MBE2316013.1 Hpt domain-containing protein [Solirubrobacter deserti]MDA0136765.1 Hpt domain-containing protein [Solirubrobacter deserti]
MNFAELEAALGADTVAQLVCTYRTDLATRLEQLRAATEPEEIRRHAHGLRSGAATFGATALAEAARVLEEGGGDLAAVERAARAVDAALATRAPSPRPPGRDRP